MAHAKISRRDLFTHTAAAASLMAAQSTVSAQSSAALPDAEARRRADLELFLKIFPPSRPPANGRINAHDKTWEDWVKRTGELPPDFASMPSVAALPDPLILRENGGEIPVTNAALCNRQKRWLRSQIEEYVIAKMPPAPDNL